MPVRSYGPRQISRAPLPGVRRTAAETATSQGADLEHAKAQTGQVISGAGLQLTRAGVAAFTGLSDRDAWLAEQAREAADATARLKWQNQFAEFEKTRINDPEKGVLATKGEAAFGLPEAVSEEFNTLAGGIEAGLMTDKQRLQFEQDRLAFGSSVEGVVSRHVRDQIQQFKGEQMQARVENARSAIGQHAIDPRRVDLELAAGEEAIRANGPALGMSGEQIANEVRKFRSAAHVDAISGLIASGHTAAAKVYFEEANSSGQIDGAAVDDVEKMVRSGTVRKQAQQETARILAGGGTFDEQRAQAKAIADPEVQDEVLQRVEHEQTVRKARERDAKETTLRTVYDVLDRAKDVTAIPEEIWRTMDPGERSAARNYADALNEGRKVATNWSTYYDLVTLSSNEATEKAFAQFNLLSVRHQLGDTEFKQLTDAQAAVRKGDRDGAAKLLVNETVQAAIVNEGLLGAGLDPTPAALGSSGYNKDRLARVVQFRRAVRGAVQAHEARFERPATDKEIQTIVDTLLTKGTAADKLAFEVSQAHIVRVADIPPTQRRLIDAAMQEAGIPASDEARVRFYNLQLKRVRGD